LRLVLMFLFCLLQHRWLTDAMVLFQAGSKG